MQWRARSAVLSVTPALVFAAPAVGGAALSVGIRAGSVNSGARISVFAGGDPSARRLAIVLVPAGTAPRLHPCELSPLCPPLSAWPVRPPLRVIGWISFKRTRGPHWTTVRLPRVAPGRYKLFALWKAPHPPGQAFLLFPASRYRGGGLVDDSQINGATLLIRP
jgi:hypothetical protein